MTQHVTSGRNSKRLIQIHKQGKRGRKYHMFGHLVIFDLSSIWSLILVCKKDRICTITIKVFVNGLWMIWNPTLTTTLVEPLVSCPRRGVRKKDSSQFLHERKRMKRSLGIFLTLSFLVNSDTSRRGHFKPNKNVTKGYFRLHCGSWNPH